MPRPGIMIYFDILEPVRMLSDADKGRLLVAMLEYGKFGTAPELDGALGIVWSFVQPKIDRDEENYDASKLQRQYAAFCKKRKKIWMPRISFDEWVLMSEDERKRAVDSVESRCPSTSTSTSTSAPSAINHHPSSINHHPSSINHHPSSINHHPSSINIQPQPSVTTYNPHQPCGEDGGDGTYTQLKVCGGELGKGVVLLTEEQEEYLLDLLGLEVYDYYMNKLSTYIIEKNAKVKNHFQTILKWWREDSKMEGGG